MTLSATLAIVLPLCALLALKMVRAFREFLIPRTSHPSAEAPASFSLGGVGAPTPTAPGNARNLPVEGRRVA